MQTDCQPKDTPLSTHLPEGALPSEPLPTAETCARQDGIAAVAILVERFSAAEVIRWARNLAAIAGEWVEPETREPAHERAGAYGEYARGSER